MTRKRRRLWLLMVGMAALGGATALVLSAFSDNLVFFYSPSELAKQGSLVDRRVRIGGLVEEHSVEHAADGRGVSFRITDGKTDIAVTYSGVLPDLFREGQGVVAEGKLAGNGVFVASTVLAKHDEKYMPPEVAEALKKSGHWQEGSGYRGPTQGAAAAPGTQIR
ncbi:MAG TPA: cytochrome c maturation protein CcmE [Stellaceae bacterium]|nr:cytochrome c maturation protein CcmE [Stellaceae bacterium]